MKNLMLSTAIIAGMATVAGAQDASMSGMFRPGADPMTIRTSNFVGMRIYAAETEIAANEFDGMQEGWKDIGEINDVIVSRDGMVDSVLVDIGGFLGMGERQIAVGMEAIRFVGDTSTPDNPDDFFLVMTAARADLEAAPDYMSGDMSAAVDAGAVEPAAEATAEITATEGEMATDLDTAEVLSEATTEGEVAVDTETADVSTEVTTEGEMATDLESADAAQVRDPIAKEGFLVAEADYLTSEKLTGARVYDLNDEWIGDVGNLVLSEDGQVTKAVVDVGGFLGMGEKPVALDITDIDILRNDAGDEVRVYLPMTKEELEALPTFEG